MVIVWRCCNCMPDKVGYVECELDFTGQIQAGKQEMMANLEIKCNTDLHLKLYEC